MSFKIYSGVDALVVGLGNPGAEYSRTRHNAGFSVVMHLMNTLGNPPMKSMCLSSVASANYHDVKLALALPRTFMNASGGAVTQLIGSLKPKRYIIIYDDIDLRVGSIRVRAQGSAGTHNGMRSIVDCLQSTDFPRIRVGIGKPPEFMDLADYVLSKITDEAELKLYEIAIREAADACLMFIEHGIEAAMRNFNTNKKDTPPPC